MVAGLWAPRSNMRTPPSQAGACGSYACWFLALFAGLVILVQASWLRALRECDGVLPRSPGDASKMVLTDPLLLRAAANASDPVLLPAAASALVPAPAPEPVPSPAPAGRKTPPRVLIVTAEQPTECSTTAAQWLGARAMRNRLHYAQEHAYKLYWFTDIVDPDYKGIQENAMWNKPALLAKLLDNNITEGVEWLLWIDSDAIFMDMSFELPLDEYVANGYHLVLWGEPRMVNVTAPAAPSYFGINAGVLLMRNSGWTRDFLKRILAAGDDIAASTAEQRKVMKGWEREEDGVVSDQSTIVYMLYTEPEQWRAQTLLEKRFALNGHWQQYYGRLVPGTLQLSSAIWGTDRVPFVMHFAGCQLCSGKTDAHYANWDECRDAMAQALNYAEDWALAQLGLRHKSLTALEVIKGSGRPTYPEPPPVLHEEEEEEVAASSSAADEEDLEALAALQPPADQP